MTTAVIFDSLTGEIEQSIYGPTDLVEAALETQYAPPLPADTALPDYPVIITDQSVLPETNVVDLNTLTVITRSPKPTSTSVWDPVNLQWSETLTLEQARAQRLIQSDAARISSNDADITTVITISSTGQQEVFPSGPVSRADYAAIVAEFAQTRNYEAEYGRYQLNSNFESILLAPLEFSHLTTVINNKLDYNNQEYGRIAGLIAAATTIDEVNAITFNYA